MAEQSIAPRSFFDRSDAAAYSGPQGDQQMESMTVFKSLTLPFFLIFLIACTESNGIFEEVPAEDVSGNADAAAGTADSGTPEAVTDTDNAGNADNATSTDDVGNTSATAGTVNSGTPDAVTDTDDAGNTDNVNSTGNAGNTGTTVGTDDTGTTDSTSAGTGVGTDAETTDSGSDAETISSTTTIGSANCSPLVATGDATKIAGLYDWSNEQRVWYLEIFDNGTTKVYDYRQDNVNQSGNCYIILSDYLAFSALGNDLYVSTIYLDPNINCETLSDTVTIVRGESQLSFISVDTNDLDEDGDTTELVSDILPVASGISSESFNNCE